MSREKAWGYRGSGGEWGGLFDEKPVACVASVSVRFGIFGSLPIFRAGKTPKIPFFAPKPHGNACYAG